MTHNEKSMLQAEVLSCREIHELPGTWGQEDLVGLLANLEIDTEGATGADLLDLALMALGDLEWDEAGIAVLKVVFGDTMTAGLRGNLASGLDEDRPWEDFADLARQEGIFTSVVLLQKAFPRVFGKPDAMRVEVAFTTPTAEEALLLPAASAATILRALAPGLGPRSIVTRLYGEGLQGAAFPEAEQILWRRSLQIDPQDPRRVLLEIHGAENFLGELGEADPWQVNVKLHS